MGRIASKAAGRIYQNCDKIAELNNEIRRLRAENMKLEHGEHISNGGIITNVIEFRNLQNYPRHTQRPQPKRAA